jgi:uncharacterized membrane protein YhaH (DUF805 family)
VPRSEIAVNWTWYLFGFEGRINRARFWLGSLVMLGWMLLCACLAILWLAEVVANTLDPAGKMSIYFSVNPLLELSLGAKGDLVGGHASIHFGIDQLLNLFNPAFYHSLSPRDVVPLAVNAVVTPVLLWMYLAISIKRLHDRDRSGWWVLPFLVLPVLHSHFEGSLPDSYFFLPLSLAAFVFTVWGFIELACLKGDASTNRFGPNPLGKQQIRPRSTEMRLRTTTAWDQESEIELAPHRASPLSSMHVKRGA